MPSANELSGLGRAYPHNSGTPATGAGGAQRQPEGQEHNQEQQGGGTGGNGPAQALQQ